MQVVVKGLWSETIKWYKMPSILYPAKTRSKQRHFLGFLFSIDLNSEQPHLSTALRSWGCFPRFLCKCFSRFDGRIKQRWVEHRFVAALVLLNLKNLQSDRCHHCFAICLLCKHLCTKAHTHSTCELTGQQRVPAEHQWMVIQFGPQKTTGETAVPTYHFMPLHGSEPNQFACRCGANPPILPTSTKIHPDLPNNGTNSRYKSWLLYRDIGCYI